MPAEDRCATCDAALDLGCYARCDVCKGARLCLDCARGHLCTPRCASNGCVAGLCVHVVRAGAVDARYGVVE